MAAKKRRHKSPVDEDLDLLNKRRCGNFPEWWDKYTPEELAKMQRRGHQLVAGDPITWDDLTGLR